jgi:hypothetical protein
MPDVLRKAFSETRSRPASPIPEIRKSETKEKGNKGKERSREYAQPSQNTQNTDIWMGMETPFKSANSWFTEPGKSNRSRQPGTSKTSAVETNILVGIATPLAPTNASGVRQWAGREEPPHLATQGVGNPRMDTSQRSASQDAKRPPRRENREGGDSDPESSLSSDEERGRSSRGHRSRKRSKTPKPQCRRSSTPRPRGHRRRKGPEDSNGNGGGGSSGGTSTASSTSSRDSRHSRHRNRSRSRSQSIEIPYGRITPVSSNRRTYPPGTVTRTWQSSTSGRSNSKQL